MIRNQWWRSNDVLYNVVSFNRHRKLPYPIFRPTNHNSNCRTTNLFPSRRKRLWRLKIENTPYTFTEFTMELKYRSQ